MRKNFSFSSAFSSIFLLRLLPFSGIVVLAGCANLPPLIQDHHGVYGLYLPTAQELLNAMTYQEVSKILGPDGQTIILERNETNGKMRFLYPNGGYISLPGWRNMQLISSMTLPNGNVQGLFQGIDHGQPTEMMVIFHKGGIRGMQLNIGSAVFAPEHVTSQAIIYQQMNNATDPLYRVYNIRENTLSPGILQSTIERNIAEIKARKEQEKEALLRQKEALERQREEARTRRERARAEEQLQANRAAQAQQQQEQQQERRQPPQQAHAELVVQAIALSGGAMKVQSAVPIGHQRVAPQMVNLQ